MFEAFLAFLAEYTVELAVGAAIVAIVETVFKPFRGLASLFRKLEKAESSDPEVLQEAMCESRKVPEWDALFIAREIAWRSGDYGKRCTGHTGWA